MDILDKAYDRAACELEDILQHQKLDKQDVDMFGAFVDIIKDVYMTDSYKDSLEGYSQMNGSSYRNRPNMTPMYGRGSSYMRGRSMNNGYSRNDNKEMMLDHLADIADMATDEKDRRAVEKLISQMSER